METMSRIESAAVTRRTLLDKASELLDTGGPDAVTLREVGARAGVSRGAPYRHFAEKESLLTAVAAEGWERLGDDMQALRTDTRLLPADKLRGALIAVINVSRQQPYLYELMFSTPAGDPSAVVRAAQRMCDEFLAIVADGGRRTKCSALRRDTPDRRARRRRPGIERPAQHRQMAHHRRGACRQSARHGGRDRAPRVNLRPTSRVSC
jgi:AcrR family transcriptional regulator